MKKIKFFASVFIALVLCNACKEEISPSNKIVTASRNVSNFTGLDIANGFEVTIVRATVEELKIEAPENYLPYIYTTVNNGVLKIEADPKILTGTPTTRRLFISMKNLDKILASGGTRLTSTDKWENRNLELNLSGGSSVGLTEITYDKIMLQASGGSLVTWTGVANNLDIKDLSGGSRYLGFGLSCNTANINAAGGATVELTVNQDLTVTASGGSIIRYKGKPTINVNLSGGSQLVNSN